MDPWQHCFWVMEQTSTLRTFFQIELVQLSGGIVDWVVSLASSLKKSTIVSGQTSCNTFAQSCWCAQQFGQGVSRLFFGIMLVNRWYVLASLLLSLKCFAPPSLTRRQGCTMLTRGCKVLSRAYSWSCGGCKHILENTIRNSLCCDFFCCICCFSGNWVSRSWWRMELM